MRKRMHQIDLFRKYPKEVQQEWLQKLLEKGKETSYGRQQQFANISSYEDFKNTVPLSSYEDLAPYITLLREGKQGLLWPTDTKWFAKSSGTSGSKSKYIPVTEESLIDCHFKGGKDMLSIYCENYPDNTIFNGKSLILGGSHEPSLSEDAKDGDLSAIIMDNLPFWVNIHRTPNKDIALLNDFEEKIEQMAEISSKENVTNIAGVPSWMLVLFKKILEKTGAKHIHEVWPNLELYMHGGVSFTPYREQFDKLLPNGVNYLETYNASEGFFGIQDQKDTSEMLLMLDYGIFYEFIPTDDFKVENAIPIWEAKEGVNYAMIISTNAGLWRYLIGDTIVFSSLQPYRFSISGRTSQFLNTFGEELIMDNTDKALAIACQKTQSTILEYSVAPIFMKEGKGGHEWVIEFEKEPLDLDFFSYTLDEALKSVNSDYEAKRYKNMALQEPSIHLAQKGLFYAWMKQEGKLGRQFKVPRLSPKRQYIESLLKMNAEPLKS
jgi:hypothetical protein